MSVRLLLYVGGSTLISVLLFACGGAPAGEPTATPDLIATEVAIKKAAAATLTAEAALAQPPATQEESPAIEPPAATETPVPPPSPTTEQSTSDTIQSPDTATPIPSQCTVVANGLNLRRGPGVVFEAVGTLLQGTEIIPQARIADNTWVEVQVQETGQTGWVSAGAQFISCNFDITGLPLGQIPPTPTPLPTDTPVPPTPTEPAPPTPTPPLLVDVPVDGGQGNLKGKIVIPGFTRDELNVSGSRVTFRDRLVFRAEVYDPDAKKGDYDGAGIKNVKIRVFEPNSDPDDNDDSDLVHERTENNAGYCVFGGGEPDCNVFSLRDNNKWPETGKNIEDGFHPVRIVITTDSGQQETWNWGFDIDK